MSGSHSSGYEEVNGRRTTQKRSRSESSSAGSNSWQIVSNSRCIACGRLRSLCECRSLKMDPELKRKNLDTLLLNTPYVRCKQLKALDDTGREEERHRRLVTERWYESLREIKRAAHIDRCLLRVIFEEAKRRESLSAMERKEWVEGMTLSDKYMVLLAVAQCEREERLNLYASAERATRVLGAWHGAAFQILNVQSREAAFRGTLINNEAAARAALLSLELKALNTMESNEKDRLEFFEVFWAQRELIVKGWMEGLEAVERAAAESVQYVEVISQERVRFFDAVLKRRDELVVEERNARQRVYSLFEEEYSFIEEHVRFYGGRRTALMQQEVSARTVICQGAMDAYSVLFMEYRHDREKIIEIEAHKHRRREEEFKAAIESLQKIVKEEEAAFTLMKGEEHRERELRYQWMLEKEKTIINTEHILLERVRSLFSEEESARGGLMQLMQRQEAETASWLQHKERKLREIVDAALEGKNQMLVQEHEERFSLVSQKAEGEEAVRRWVDNKECARQNLVMSEATHRNRWSEMERNALEELTWRFNEGKESCYLQIQQRLEALAKFQQRALQVKGTVAKQEEEALRLLLCAVQDDRERSFREEKHRMVVDILSAETEDRHHVAQQEVGHRESITTMFLMQERFFAKEAQELLKAQMYEIITTEESHRRVLLQHVGDSVEYLRHIYKQSLEQARQKEEERIREEFRQREVALTEDARLYCEEESFCLDLGDVGQPVEGRDGRFSDAEMGLSEETWLLQRQYVVGELGGQGEDAALLTKETTAFLVTVVGAITDKEAALMAERNKAEVAVNAVRKKIERQALVFANTKEQLGESQGKLKRDMESHANRLAAQREAQQKLEAQLARERVRLKEKTAELRRMKDSVSEMRDSIHSQYKRR